jgi:hypothetical protein
LRSISDCRLLSHEFSRFGQDRLTIGSGYDLNQRPRAVNRFTDSVNRERWLIELQDCSPTEVRIWSISKDTKRVAPMELCRIGSVLHDAWIPANLKILVDLAQILDRSYYQGSWEPRVVGLADVFFGN